MTRLEVSPGFFLNVELAGDGPPIVLLHGFTGSAKGWGNFRTRLERDFTTVAIDIVGHGKSDSPEEIQHYQMPRVAADVVEATRLAGFRRATWLGYSMGGRTALHVAAAHPEAVERLIVIGGSPGLPSRAEREARVAADNELAVRIERFGIAPFVDYWESLALFATQRRLPEAIQRAIREGRLACNPVGLANSLRGMGTGAQPPLFDRLAAMAFPAMLLAGAEDAKFSGIAAEMSASIRDSRVEIVPEAGHAAHLEQPEICARLVRAFIQHHSTEGVAT
ncbi:MAG: 2-succinyl-6-hydroxy-2,4-cyclohexadiene-1-carboxylate synthase [Dehalococcoidia bacterium]